MRNRFSQPYLFAYFNPNLHKIFAFLVLDHRLFQIAVVRLRISCFGTTCPSGTLWSVFAFLALDHRLFRNAVVCFRISCLGTTCPSGTLWSVFAFRALGPHPALKTVFSQPLFAVRQKVFCSKGQFFPPYGTFFLN